MQGLDTQPICRDIQDFFGFEEPLNQILIDNVTISEDEFVNKAQVYNNKIFKAYKKTT